MVNEAAIAEDTKKQIYFNTAKIESLAEGMSGLEAKVESTSSRLAKIEKVGYMIAGAFFLFNAGPGILDQASSLMDARQQTQVQTHGLPQQEGQYGPWAQVNAAPAPIPTHTTTYANGNQITYYAMREGDGPR